MRHDFSEKVTTCVVVIDKRHSRTPHIKRRIAACFSAAGSADIQDPFMLHCLISHEMLLDGESVTAPLKTDLYTQLDLVDECIITPSRDRGKEDLEGMTVQLHYISRILDPLIVYADMTAMILRRMQASHDRYCEGQPGHGIANATIKTSDAILYLLESAESRKRWLLSYKSHKDATLNLVSPVPTTVNCVGCELKICRSSISLHNKTRLLAQQSLKRPRPMGRR